MCLAFFIIAQCKEFPLIILSNRDEFHNRPTQALHHWDTPGNILGGRDLKSKGTWLAVSPAGHFALVTNIRNPVLEKPNGPSRGSLAVNYLNQFAQKSSKQPSGQHQFTSWLLQNGPKYSGFNLVYGDQTNQWHYNNALNQAVKLHPGIHGLSNGSLNDPWPKVHSGRESLRDPSHPWTDDQYIKLLTDQTQAPTQCLPQTPVSNEMESFLAPRFIVGEGYGTRSVSVIKFSPTSVHFRQQDYSSNGLLTGEQDELLSLL